MSDIPNALRPEEWGRFDNPPPARYSKSLMTRFDVARDFIGDEVADKYGHFGPGGGWDLARIVAAANAARADDDPGKLTRRDVEALWAACRALDAEHGWPGDDTDEVVRALAAKLAALLPTNSTDDA